jgi:hypothetical protein
MLDDPSTLEMLKEVRMRLRWSLVERVTHLVLAVVVGYTIARCETDEQKLDDIARHRVEKRMQEKRLQNVQAKQKDAGTRQD